MSNETKSAPKPVSPHSLNRNELRASTFLPVIIAVGLVVLGILVWLIVPEEFNAGLAVAISVILLLFLLYWTRREPFRRRIVALILAIPALLGLSYGISNGRSGPIVAGVALTILLLALYRALTIPLSYRFAERQFSKGDYEAALNLADKAITARPDFWESYQLKSLIFMAQGDLPRAERAAKEAVTVNPRAHSAYNSLGQIYLSQAAYEPAQEAYIEAVTLQPENGLYWFYLGLCQFRRGEFENAADSLLGATKRPPRLVEYELLEYYYLSRTLQAAERLEEATAVKGKMQKFAAGLPICQAQIEDSQETPYLLTYKADLADLTRQLNS